MCERAIEKRPRALVHMPDWFVTHQQMWYEDFDDDDDDDEIIEWY